VVRAVQGDGARLRARRRRARAAFRFLKIDADQVPDIAATDAPQLFSLAAAILSLGAVYWLVKDRAGATRSTTSDAATEAPVDQV
jgi:hypothetical protein